MTQSARRPETILIAIFPVIAVGLLNGFYGDFLLRENVGWYWFFDTLQFIALPAIGFFLLCRAGYGSRDYGFRNIFRGDMAGGVGLTIFVIFLYWLTYEPVKSIAHKYFWRTVAEAPYVSGLPETQPVRFLMVLYITLSAAVVEELVFRSLPWLYFYSTMSSPVVPYVASTAILFAAIHWEHGLPNVIATAILGLAAGALYAKIRNVWPFIVAHFAVGAWSYRWL